MIVFLFLSGMVIVGLVGFSFGKHWVEMELTEGWGGGNWAAFRETKRRVGQRSMSVATYCNRLLKLI